MTELMQTHCMCIAWDMLRLGVHLSNDDMLYHNGSTHHHASSPKLSFQSYHNVVSKTCRIGKFVLFGQHLTIFQ